AFFEHLWWLCLRRLYRVWQLGEVKIVHEKGPDLRTFSLSIADYVFRLPSSTDNIYTFVSIKAAA
ncbi:MAG: hypothetical protein ACRC1W_15745, partial [Shewanella sp.]